MKENLSLKGVISLPPLHKKKKQAYYLLVSEDKNGQKSFIQKTCELFEEQKETFVDDQDANLPTVILYGVNESLAKPNAYYTKFVLEEGERARVNWKVQNGSNVVVKDYKGRILSQGRAVGGVQLVANHSQEVFIETRNEKDEISQVIAHIKVKGRKNFIKATKEVPKLQAGEVYKMEILEVDRKQYPEKITLKVIAYDAFGNFITGLSKEPTKYFKKIQESIEGKNTEVSGFAVKEVLEELGAEKVFGVCTDYSGSMGGATIEMSEKALQIFLKNKFDKDVVSMTKFDEKLANIVEPTNEKEKLLKEYKFIGLNGFGGGTALYAGADEALKSIEALKSKEKYIVLITDGFENSSFQYFETHAYTGQKLVERARKLGVKFIVVSFGDATNEVMLRTLAELTDGYFYSIDDPKDIIGAYKEIPRIFRHYYQITYKPIKAEGKRQVNLQYFNNQKTEKIVRNIQIGEKYNITDLDTQVGVSLQSGASKTSLFPNKQLLIPPQTVANFQFNKANLEWTYISNVEKYIKFLQKNPKTVVVIYGHTDLVGEKSKQVQLSAQRAEAIREQFIAKGIDASRIKIQACGKNYPIWKKEEFAWQGRENRRVEIAIYE